VLQNRGEIIHAVSVKILIVNYRASLNSEMTDDDAKLNDDGEREKGVTVATKYP
jgi:hypothetical protein